MKIQNTNYFQFANQIGIFLVILFAVCFGWYFIRGAESELHLGLFRLAYLGFDGMNFLGFILGAAQTYIWAYFFVGVWQLSGNILRLRK